MQIHDILTLPVLDMNSEGNGICKHNGAVVFVPETVTGDTVRAKIKRIEKNYAMADCLEIIKFSDKRREADCPCYRKCGGCTLRHVKRETELTIKENTVKQALRRMYLNDKPEVFRPIRAGEENSYRNKAVFHGQHFHSQNLPAERPAPAGRTGAPSGHGYQLCSTGQPV